MVKKPIKNLRKTSAAFVGAPKGKKEKNREEEGAPF